MKFKRTILFILAIAVVMTSANLGTIAWFTDQTSSGQNKVQSGNLKAALMQDGKELSETDVLFDEIAYWEPGAVAYENLTIKNVGDLAFKYQLHPNVLDWNTIDGTGLSLMNALKFAVVEGKLDENSVREEVITNSGLNWAGVGSGGAYSSELLKSGETRDLAMVIWWEPTDNDNSFNLNNGKKLDKGDFLSIDMGVKLSATQAEFEADSFGTDYDQAAQLPRLNIRQSVPVNVVDGKVASEAVITVGDVRAVIPAGVLVDGNAQVLTLVLESKDRSDANITLSDTEIIFAYDVKIEGVSKDNTVPMEITLGEAAPKYMNIGPLELYHVDADEKIKMRADGSGEANSFDYDPATGFVTVYLATFSEVAVVADTVNAWGGTVAEDFSGGTGTEEDPYIIASADQLAYMNELVSADNDDENPTNDYGNKHYRLIADVNFGGSGSKDIFYPIGYHKKGKGTNNAGETWYTYGGVFSGTFDGAGHTISGIYQNTWAMDGDYDNGYYNDAMGLFGYVNGGTVKNLAIDNFYSEGEFAPTGCVAAYAAGDATFMNIAITNSHPQTYNTGVAGIVGWDKSDNSNFTFENITVDDSNTISALWGTYDCAAAGLLGRLGEKSTATLKNCHVSAVLDVYNDVCANYQYYWYRYCGMLIGTVDRHTKDANGYTIPDTTGIKAENCTVTYGDWHEYRYCEFKELGAGSYNGPGEWKFCRSDNDRCADGHTHGDNESCDVLIPFNQLFTGYGWGVRGVAAHEGVTVYTKPEVPAKSVEKFEYIGDETYTDGKKISLGELFKVKDGASISDTAVCVGITVLTPKTLKVEQVWEETNNPLHWEKSALQFTGTGVVKLAIQDYYYCTPTTVTLSIGERIAIKKFENLFTNEEFCYRIGNQNNVKLSSLFKALVSDEEIGNVSVIVEAISGNAQGVYTSNSTWGDGTIRFSDTGVVKVLIYDDDYCTPTTLLLEVVDAVNATGATNATANNVVLLNDCGFSSLEVSGGYALYGNGFTMTCSSDSAALDMGYSFVTLNNGTLDNVQIDCPNFDYAVLYKSNMTESGNRSETTDRTRYYNVKSGVMASGNSQILNSRISGGRAAVNVSGGNVVIDNSRIELGAVASVLVGTANSLTMRDVTLVQKPTASTYDSSKTLMGFSVLFVCDANGDAAPVKLEGTLTQNAWIDENDKQYVPSAGQSIISTVLGKTEYLHDLDGDGTKESLNLGFAYMPESLTSKVNATTITDNRENQSDVPYGYAEVSILNGKTYVYSYKNTNGTDDSFKTESEYEPNKYSDIITVTYSDTADGLSTGKSFGTDGWVYELNVDLDKLSGYALDFSKLSMSVNGVSVTDFKVNGNAKPTSPVTVDAGGTTYTLTATVNGKEYTATYKVTGTETSKEPPSLVASNYEAGLCVASSKGGTWHGAAPALEGIQIKYWSVAEKQYKTINLSDYTPTTKGQLNGTNTTWTYSPDNGDFTLTLTGGKVHSSNNVYAMPVSVDTNNDDTADTLYFVASSSKGLVNSGNSARTIPVSYTFKDNNNGDVLTFSHSWSVAENTEEEYDYSDFCSGTLRVMVNTESGGSSTCVTPDTLITLADGKQVRVDSLKGDEQLLVWNMETGALDSAPIMFVDNDPEAEYEIVHLYFSDGTDVKVIYEHGFWDYDLNRYVYLDANAAQYIGHSFFKQDGNGGTKVQLTDVVVERELTTAWSPVTAGHLCYFVNDMLSMPGGVGGLFNIFEVDPATMTYDMDAMARDIETYGLLSYEELSEYAQLPREMFDAAGGQYLKVSMGKGNLTMEELVTMIERYGKFF